MAQQVELAPSGVRSPARDDRSAGKPSKATRSYSARRVITTLVVGLLFAGGVVAGLNYIVNSAAYQSTDDAFIDGHIIPVSAKVAGRVQSVFVLDNQMVNKGDLVTELDPLDFDAAAHQKSAALESTQAQ